MFPEATIFPLLRRRVASVKLAIKRNKQMKQMNIGLIGTGSMGTALGKLLIKAGYRVSAWNRTSAKAIQLKDAGALVEEDLISLLRKSDFIIICVADYQSSYAILKSIQFTAGELSGKTFIQLSTGTPEDARAFKDWIRPTGVSYLDGAIMSTPSQMGTEEAMMLIAGDKITFEKHSNVLQTLAPNTRYMGAGISLASAWDLALLSYFFSSMIGLAHAAKIAKAEGIEISELGSSILEWSPGFGAIMKDAADMIATGSFENTESTVKTCFISSELIQRHAEQAGISMKYPEFATNIFATAMRSGMANEDGVAIFKTL